MGTMSTGIFIRIEKDSEEGEWVAYRFFEPESEPGILRISRTTGICELIKPSPSDSKEKELYTRASAKLRRLLRRDGLPERTHWAS